MSITTVHAEPGTYDAHASILAMLSDDEKSLYFQNARAYTGVGAVLEIGPWLGASTFQICRGLEESGHPWSLTVLDRFKWSSLYESSYPHVPLKRQESTLPLFRENLSHYSANIHAIAGEIRDIQQIMPLRENIEMLFVDAPKSWRMLWTVLNHVGPRLLPGARITFQDFLHITSRQIAWLVASLPMLEATEVVGQGTSVAFRLNGRLPNFAQDVPIDINQISSSQLIGLWEKLSAVLPESRSCELAAGLALDLLERRDWDLAALVLDRALRDSPSAPMVVTELTRLLRKSPGSKMHLMQVLAYLRADAAPAATARAYARASATEEPAAEHPAAGDTTDREAALAAAKVLGAGNTAGALAARHVAFHGLTDDTTFRRIYTALQSCIELDLPALAESFAPLVPGARVVELNGGLTINATLMRALGADSYVGITSEADRARRTHRNPLTMARVRVPFASPDLEGLDPAISFVDDIGRELDRSADLVIARPEPTAEALKQSIDTALGLLKPGGRLALFWRNPRSWSGHGRSPQTVAEMKRNDAEQAKVVDWAHLSGIRNAVPSLGQLREQLENRFSVERWTEELDDPNAVIRMTPRTRRANAKLGSADFIVRMAVITARA
jgi:hypothetical protein